MTITKETERLITALDDTGYWWMIGKGKTRSTEPMWGCLIQAPAIDGDTLAKAEHDTSLDFCIIEALERLRNAGH